jgi:hypothetical protein
VKRIKPRLDEVIAAGRRGAWRADPQEHEQHQCCAPWPSHSPEPSRFHQALPLSWLTLMGEVIDPEFSYNEMRLRLESSMQPMDASRMYPAVAGLFKRINQKNAHPDARPISPGALGGVGGAMSASGGQRDA